MVSVPGQNAFAFKLSSLIVSNSELSLHSELSLEKGHVSSAPRSTEGQLGIHETDQTVQDHQSHRPEEKVIQRQTMT